MALLLAACESEKAPSFIKGNPYAKEFARLNGPVKSAVYSYYKNGKLDSSIQNDYSTEGVLLKSKTLVKGDSIVIHYTYDPYNNIQDMNGTGITDYRAEYKKGTLVKEWLYSDKKKKNGITNRYKIKGETLIKKVNDIRTGAGITYTYSYNSRGLVKAVETMVNDGSYCLYSYDEKDHPVLIEYFTPKGKPDYQVHISTKYDSYDNCIQYVSRRDGKITEEARIRYKYYSEEELQQSKLQAESAITNSSIIRHAYSSEPTPPSTGLMAAIILCTAFFLTLYISYAQKHWGLFRNFGGKVEYNGMRKMWMYNSEPYVKMATIFTSIIGAFLSSILVLLLFGGITWFVFWILNLMLWGLIIIGWIVLVIGVILLLFRRFYGIAGILVGGILVLFSDTLKDWGEQFIQTGSDFMDNVNALDWTLSIFHTYGHLILLVIAAPIACFLLLALALILFSYVLRLIEFAAIKAYNVHRPCPVCGNKKDFSYIVEGKVYPIELKPGVYGIFHQTNHHTHVRVPTMLVNGKAKLTRKCQHCQQFTNLSHDKSCGTDLHIGIVGERSSGKSYLLYRGLELLSQRFGKAFQQVDVDGNQKWEMMAQRIHQGEGIQTAVKNRYKAIQIRLKLKFRPMPYQLFFYDVAGEKFNVNMAKTTSALEFYTNVGTILFVIDPSMIDIQKCSPSPAFEDWHKKHSNPSENYDMEATLSTLKDIIQQVGRKTQDIDLIVTCTKKDLGYLEACHYPYECNEQKLRRFIKEELGLYNLDNAINNGFKSVGYAAVSTQDADKTSLEHLFLKVLKQRGGIQL